MMTDEGFLTTLNMGFQIAVLNNYSSDYYYNLCLIIAQKSAIKVNNNL